MDSSSTRSAAAAAARPTAEALSRYGRAQRFLELAGICFFAVLLVLNLHEIREASIGILLAAALTAWMTADLLSGIAHWAFDSFGNVRTPLFGPAFIRPFREHHVDPQAMTRHDFVETNGASCLACVPLLVFSLCLEAGFPRTFCVLLALGILATNQCHKWAHAGEAPFLVGILQKAGIVLAPEAHRRHHTAPFASHYCTASGWLNRPLDAALRVLRG